MTTLTRTEIKWILNMVIDNRESSGTLMNIPGQKYAALHKLEFENMASLAEKLDGLLKTDAKRIAIR